jgi:hypothetical protein
MHMNIDDGYKFHTNLAKNNENISEKRKNPSMD